MLQIFEILILLHYVALGEKHLLTGLWNPTSFTINTVFRNNFESSLNNVSITLPQEDALIFSLEFDPKKAVVFAAIETDINIYSNFDWQNGSANFSTLYYGMPGTCGQIAFDFLSNNLYWCDSMLSWIAMKPAYNSDNTIYKIVVQKNLNKPEGLCLDPDDRLMFFSDNYPTSRIEKAFLDGQERVVIVHKGLLRVLSLTVDAASNKLYWADHDRQTLEVCDYDGSNRRVIRRIYDVSVTDITFHQNVLHAASVGVKQIFGVSVESNRLLYSRTFHTEEPFAITVYDTEPSGSVNDPCSSLNCHHMCINAKTGPKCLCSEGFYLDDQSKQCTKARTWFERGFIVSNASMLVMHDIHSTNGHYYDSPTTVFADTIETFAVDSNLDIVYFVDRRSSALHKYDIISTKQKYLASISSAKDLTFDWIANLLGWIEPTLSCIQSFSINTQTSSTIYSGLEQPVSFTVDCYNGVLYWIAGNLVRSIFQGTWYGDGPNVLISAANLNSPSSLQYDVTSNRLYWLDLTIIKSSLPNGLDMKSHIDTGGAFKAFVYKKFLGWIYEDTINFATEIISRETYTHDTVENVKDVAVFDSSLQQDKRGTCVVLHGGCGEICIPEENGRRCECDIGHQLQPDQSCDSDVLPANFIVVTDYSHGRILQICLQTGFLVKLPLTINQVVGLAFDKSTQRLIYSERWSNTITTTTLQGNKIDFFFIPGFGHADRLAIDYSTGNIFYTGVGPTDTQSYIGVVHKTMSLHKTLMENLHNPRNIVLYPSRGYLFWTEVGMTAKIGRANMDGTSKTYIVTTKLIWPNGLTIDFTSGQLYWTDRQRNCIETSDINGGNRKVIATDSDAHIMSIVIHGQFLYYTAWNRQSVTKIDKRTGSKISFMPNYPELGRLDSLDIYADDFTDESSSCSSKNGLCSTFCFPTPTGKTCGCQDKVNLQSDQLTCQRALRCPTQLQNLILLNCLPFPGFACDFECTKGYRRVTDTTLSCESTGQWSMPTDSLCEDELTANFILVTDYLHGRLYQINLETGNVLKLPQKITKIKGLAFDQRTKTLFYSENLTKTITSTTLQGKNTTLFIATGVAYADRLAIDYSTGNLFFTAVGLTESQSYIGVVHRSTSLHKTLINNLDSPKDITLYISKGYVFWTALGKIPKIGRAYMDGTSISYIATTEVGWPNGLTIDFTSNRLYWTNGKRNSIESSDLDGENRKIVAFDSNANLIDIISHGRYLYYTAGNRQGVTKIDKITGTKFSFVPHHVKLEGLDSLAISADDVRDVSSSCSSRNGLCSTFCFPTPTGKTCGCQDSVTLHADQLTCQGVTRCPLEVLNGHLTSTCWGIIGEKCELICNGSREVIQIICQSSGFWDKNTTAICSQQNKCENSITCWSGEFYAGFAFPIIIGIAGMIYMQMRNGNLIVQNIRNRIQIGNHNVLHHEDNGED